ncbi:Tex family protein [Cerasicoccus arenae]|uniref:RNA-binding transcriptional accessory protein n=1 Tax=Cerasicoccus arenae TaxID=424488 RepID=A0A8J3DGC0_9BACT|nr:Tex family protein [Cerasicoccus arenae]MBK1856884.1 RNA-binding transcriptional accessory protein [Cerasicoccus arenae]GHB89651.1 RNA-binding transcriptional accessory protein [Cerasicoccus arenae]
MNELHILTISKELNVGVAQVIATATLFNEGATVPFIARYRKEATGQLDEVQITSIRDRLSDLKMLDDRRSSIIKSLEERKLLTDELRKLVEGAESVARLEDVYQPYRPKRRTRAMIAQEKGLTPLADFLFENQNATVDDEAAKFVVESEEENKAVPDADAALKGARDILAERFSDDTEMRVEMRKAFEKDAILESKVMFGKEAEGIKYQDYYDFSESVATIPSHRLLAIRRGSNDGFLYFRILVDEDRATDMMKRRFLTGNGPAAEQISLAIEDSFKRLLGPSMETDSRLTTKKRADEQAIKVFMENLRELLLASPLGQKRVMAIDPGFRTGCKVVCLDAQGALLHNTVIYPGMGGHKNDEAVNVVLAVCHQFQIEAIAIGNGTAGRETEAFIRQCGLPASITIVMVNESGASIYSASEVAREEFPDQDLTVRGAVSIGRRLMDPLAELVKLDPKSIGVGQYQHDVDQLKLKDSLDDIVVSCVNGVGVEVNTASKQLLKYVSGLNTRLAENIVAARTQNGPFKSRKQLLKVPGMGPKSFEQCAGFLRIRGGEHPLDGSAVHPERYALVEQMATDAQCTVADLLSSDSHRQRIKLEKYVSDEVGLPTLKDIQAELSKPGRDPREQFESFSFAEGINKVEDLSPGLRLPGIVTNVAAFGAFVDVGVHQDGLVHISELSDNFVNDPAEVVKVQQRVQVTVLEVDIPRGRISLSMKTQREGAQPHRSAGRGSDRAPAGTGNQRRPTHGSNQRGNDRSNNRGNDRGRSQNFGNSLGDLF